MSDDIAISVKNVSKAYRIWRDPAARLKAPLWDVMGSVIPAGLRPKALQDRLGHVNHSKYYKDFYALNDVSFEIKKGETMGIIGRNGSGKSTLLQIICGTLQPTQGSVISNGRIAALLELGSGFNPDFTGRENVYLNASVLGLTRQEIDSRIDDILGFADIGDFVDQPTKTYSSGMFVRLAFAVQTAVDPRILIVDEALSVGDELFQRKCFQRIENMRDSGTSILFVSHDASAVVRLCNGAILLRQGRIFIKGSPKSVVSIYQKGLFDSQADDSSLKADFESLEKVSGINYETKSAAITERQPETDDDATMDSSLLQHKPLEYTSNGATISSASIKTISGVCVNSLQHGHEYVFAYTVDITQPAQKVVFCNLIKLIDGTEIGGMLTHPLNGPRINVCAGEIYQIKFRFKCLLKKGIYSLNAGVLGVTDDDETYLARSVDALLFRVKEGPYSLSTALVNFMVDSNWSKVN